MLDDSPVTMLNGPYMEVFKNISEEEIHRCIIGMYLDGFNVRSITIL